jgi:hypothetical protein
MLLQATSTKLGQVLVAVVVVAQPDWPQAAAAEDCQHVYIVSWLPIIYVAMQALQLQLQVLQLFAAFIRSAAVVWISSLTPCRVTLL